MKKFLFFLFLTVGGYVFGQTNTPLVNYKFDQSNLTPDAGAIGSPSISLVNNPTTATSFNTTYATGNPNTGKALTTNVVTSYNYGGYIKLIINTTGYTKISISFDGRGDGNGSGTTYWDVYARKDNNSLVALDLVDNTLVNGDGAWKSFNKTLSTTNNPDFDNSPSVTIYIVAYNNAPASRVLRIDNLKITGCKIPAAPTATAQTFCSVRTVADLVATGDSGNTFSWYTVESGGTALASTTALSTGTYYVSQSNNCGNSSPRTAVAVTVYPLPAAPTVSGGGTFCGSATISATGGSGETVYYQGTTSNGTSTTSGGSPQTVTASGTYYFRSQNANGCWGPQSSVTVTIATPPSAVASAPVPANNASGVCYQGPGAVSSVSWIAVAGATSYDVYFGAGTLPGTLTANVTTNSYNTGVLLPNTTYHWKVVPRNICGITTGAPVEWTFTTASTPCTVSYCTPTTETPSNSYITDVEFRGTLNDVQNNKNGMGSSGYQNFTTMANKTRQAAGEGMNVFVKSNEVDVNWKVWVDWNRDGNFNESVYNVSSNPTGEIVFVSGIGAISTTFGFVIHPSTVPGDYVIRIRNNRYLCGTNPDGSPKYCRDTNFKACDDFTGTTYGETEDYVIRVIANCASSIVSLTPVETCGSASFAIKATGNAGTTKIRWYDAETGGTVVAETLADASFQSTYITPILSASKTYWVTSFNGICETLYRKPVVASIKPIPQFTFSLPPGNANFCGDDDRLVLSTNGALEEVTLINENFETVSVLPMVGSLFTASSGPVNTANTTTTGWQPQKSIFQPTGAIWKPAISSGYDGDRFAYATSDYSSAKVETILTTINSYNTTDFTSLELAFSAYYSFYNDLTQPIVEGFHVEVSTDGGSNWTSAKTYTESLGFGTAFQTIKVDFTPYRNVTALKIRFRYIAYWGDGIAIDDIKLYGIKPLTTSFVWTAPNIGVYQANCTTPYVNGTPTASVCIKPSDLQMQTISDWNISAQQTVSNGCATSATIAIHNQNKVWDTTASTNWGVTNWQPTTDVPAIDKCVLIKKPVNILTGGDFEAKNVKVVTGGTLTINKDASLKIQDYIRNETGSAANVVVESDGSLVQFNEGNTINTGSITAKRVLNLSSGRQQFNYLISPLEGQSLKTIYPGMGYVLYHNEANNFFYNSSGAYIKGRALALQEPNLTAVPATTVTAVFTGYPTNGAFSYGLVNTNVTNTVSRGFNLVGNPYPSNIDLITLYSINGGASGKLSPTFSFWDNRANNQIKQMGDGYGQQAYAQFIATAPPSEGTGVLATGDTTALEGTNKPTRYVKMGQGFMVQSKVASLPLQFNNTIRTTEKGTVSFFGKGAQSTKTPIDRYWLNMITPGNQATQIAVVYFEGGNNSFGIDDAFSLGGSDAVYSIVGTEKVSINGKNSFVTTDVVPLGTTHFVAGNYTFALQDKEGVFASGQPIYLKDKQTGVITNLSEGQYIFTANAGESTGRFEIVYQSETVLATDDGVKKEIQVYRDGSDFVVKASTKKITELQMYDASGKLIKQLQPDSKEISIDLGFLNNGVYFLKIIQGDLVSVKKIIK